MDAQLRAFCWNRQGLDGSLRGRGAAEVLELTGWSRSVGGCGPYLALFARADLSRATVDAALHDLSVQELPAARGCTYVVPASDFGIALRASRGHGDGAEIATAKKYLGVTDKEIYKLCEGISEAVDGKVLDPQALKVLLASTVRNLGPEGKKRGVTNTLSLGLGKLQSEGVIRRVPVNGRLDQQRYGYTLWASPPKCQLSDEELAVELARRYFRWAGAATAAQFAWWSGLGVKAAKAAVVALSLVPLTPGDERFAFADDRDSIAGMNATAGVQLALVGSLDNCAHLRRDAAQLLDASDATIQVLGDKGMVAGQTLRDFPHHAILDRGRVVGYWEFDSVACKIAWGTFSQAPAALSTAVARTEEFVRDTLGDARSFSLDSPESRGARIAAVRQLGA